jgi:hypothetical protein
VASKEKESQMNELNMSIYTGKNDENKVTLTAAFDTHDEAVAFHNGMAELCNKHSHKGKSVVSTTATNWAGKLLPAR